MTVGLLNRKSRDDEAGRVDESRKLEADKILVYQLSADMKRLAADLRRRAEAARREIAHGGNAS